MPDSPEHYPALCPLFFDCQEGKGPFFQSWDRRIPLMLPFHSDTASPEGPLGSQTVDLVWRFLLLIALQDLQTGSLIVCRSFLEGSLLSAFDPSQSPVAISTFQMDFCSFSIPGCSSHTRHYVQAIYLVIAKYFMQLSNSNFLGLLLPSSFYFFL